MVKDDLRRRLADESYRVNDVDVARSLLRFLDQERSWLRLGEVPISPEAETGATMEKTRADSVMEPARAL